MNAQRLEQCMVGVALVVAWACTSEETILCTQAGDDVLEATNHPREAVVVEVCAAVRRLVVVRIAQEGRVRDHERRVPMLPERPMVGIPRRCRGGEGGTERRERRALAKSADCAANEGPRTGVADESHEVPGGGVQPAERERVLLAPSFVGVVPQAFEAQRSPRSPPPAPDIARRTFGSPSPLRGKTAAPR